jgi:hypothetical protein
MANEMKITEESESHSVPMVRLWKAMGEPQGMKDAELIRKAAVRIRNLQIDVNRLSDALSLSEKRRDEAEAELKKLHRRAEGRAE